MKPLQSILRRQVVQDYPRKKLDLEFCIEALRCYKIDQHTFRTFETQTQEVPPFACSFNKSLLKGNMLAVADEDGCVNIFDLRKKCSESVLKDWVAHSNAIFDLTWIDHEPKLVTASGDQTAVLWDIQHSKKLAVFRGHSSSLKSVDFQEGSPFVFATGARDGNIMIWDIRCNKRDGYYQAVNTLRNCHSTIPSGNGQGSKKKKRSASVVGQASQQSVTSVKYQDMNKLVSAGAVDGNIKVWDLRKNYSIMRTKPIPFHMFPYPGTGTRKHGFSSLVFDSYKSRLFANCTNDIIYMYDCMSFKTTAPLCSYHGHNNTTFYVKSAISPDDQFLLSGSGDCNAYVWNIDKPYSPPFQLTGHAGEVTSVAWCPQDQAKVATCSDDNTLRVWRVNFEDGDKSQIVGWCERTTCRNVSKPITDVPSKPSTPNTSPSRSQSSSTTSSPASLSPNPFKCSSPQQVMQTWLKSTASKRPRETGSAANENKRYCLGPSAQSIKDGINNLNTNEDMLSSCQSTSTGTTCQAVADNMKKVVRETIKHEVNKENIQVQNSPKEESPPKRQEEKKGKTSPLTENSEHLIGVKTSFVTNGKKLKNEANELSGKSDIVSSKSPSPVITESDSQEKEFDVILKHMRRITDYFKPIAVEHDSSPSKDCER